MTVVFQTFNLKSKAYCDVINISSQVQTSIKKSGIEMMRYKSNYNIYWGLG